VFDYLGVLYSFIVQLHDMFVLSPSPMWYTSYLFGMI